jgi:hypothetical protein
VLKLRETVEDLQLQLQPENDGTSSMEDCHGDVRARTHSVKRTNVSGIIVCIGIGIIVWVRRIRRRTNGAGGGQEASRKSASVKANSRRRRVDGLNVFFEGLSFRVLIRSFRCAAHNHCCNYKLLASFTSTGHQHNIQTRNTVRYTVPYTELRKTDDLAYVTRSPNARLARLVQGQLEVAVLVICGTQVVDSMLQRPSFSSIFPIDQADGLQYFPRRACDQVS